MKINQETFVLIDQYLLGQLKGASLADFEQRLKSDSEFKEAVELQREITSGIQKTAQLEFKKKLNQFHDEMTVGKTGRAKTKPNWIFISIGVVLVLIMGILYWKMNPASSVGSPAAPVVEPPAEIPVASGRQTPIFNEIIKIQNADNQEITVAIIHQDDSVLNYTFTDNNLFILGPTDTFTEPITVEISKRESNQYELQINNQTYTIFETKKSVKMQ